MSFSLTGCAEEEIQDEFVEESDTIEDINTEASTEEGSTEDTNAENLDTSNDETEANYPVGSGANLSFETVDINGNTVTAEMFKDAKIVLLNLWEPWCGPCVNEMPDLNTLYETYKDQGLLVVGAYATFEMDSDAQAIINDCGISYPIIKVDENIMQLEQEYVPASFILDHNGNLITEEPIEGSRSYEDWEKIVTSYLQ